MNKLKILLYLILTASLCTLPGKAWAGTDKSGTTAAQFLKIGVGARAMGQAGAMVALSDDVYSLYWNPSGIVKVRGITFAAVHSKWFADISHQFIGLVIPINDWSAIGMQATALNMDAIEITTIDNPHGTGEYYDASDLSLGVTYATRLTDFFSFGITGKYVMQSIYNESAGAFAVDIGSTLDIPFHGLRLGMNFSNFGGKLQMDGRDLIREYDLNPENTLNDGVEVRLKTVPWELPVNFAVGLSMDLVGAKDGLWINKNNHVTLSVAGNHPADAPEFASFGLEYIFHDVLALRGGYRLNRDVEKFFYGAGIKAPFSGAVFSFDYSLASYGELDMIHIFSASIAFQQ